MKKEKNSSVFRKELKRDWNTLKSLKGWKKLEFLWDYYKLPAAITVTLIFVICIFVHMLWDGQKPCRLRVCAVLNTDDDCSHWFREFEKEIKKDGEPGSIEVNQDQPFDYNNQYYYLHELEVMTTVSSQRMDVAVCNADMYQYLLAINACLPLDTALPADLYESLSEKDMLDYNTANLQEDENGQVDISAGIDGYYAVNLNDTDFSDRYNQTDEQESLYAVIISNTKNEKDSIALIRALSK